MTAPQFYTFIYLKYFKLFQKYPADIVFEKYFKCQIHIVQAFR